MPSAQPPHDNPEPHAIRNNLAAAATDMMWACALATTRTAIASTARGLAFWSLMLRPALAAPLWPLPGALLAQDPWSKATPDEPSPAQDATPTDSASGETPAFARYRSSSGHAAVQVIVSN